MTLFDSLNKDIMFIICEYLDTNNIIKLYRAISHDIPINIVYKMNTFELLNPNKQREYFNKLKHYFKKEFAVEYGFLRIYKHGDEKFSYKLRKTIKKKELDVFANKIFIFKFEKSQHLYYDEKKNKYLIFYRTDRNSLISDYLSKYDCDKIIKLLRDYYSDKIED